MEPCMSHVWKKTLMLTINKMEYNSSSEPVRITDKLP